MEELTPHPPFVILEASRCCEVERVYDSKSDINVAFSQLRPHSCLLCCEQILRSERETSEVAVESRG